MRPSSSIRWFVVAAAGCLSGCLVAGGRGYVGGSVDSTGAAHAEVGLTGRIGYAAREWTGGGFRADAVVGTDSLYSVRSGLELVTMGEAVGVSTAVLGQVGVGEPISGFVSDSALLIRLDDRVSVHDNGLRYLTRERRIWSVGVVGRAAVLHHGDDEDEWRGRIGFGVAIDVVSLHRTFARPGRPRSVPRQQPVRPVP